MPLDPTTPTLRSQRLNQITHAPHEQLDKAVKAHAPFATLASYSRFVVAQYLFQSELQSLYNDPALQAIIHDLPARCRAAQAKADLADLNMDIPLPVPGAVQSTSKAEALGWLFVSEGSKLGAAFLIKRAEALNLSDRFGARHLGEPEGGRAAGWKTFVRTLDEMPLTAEQEAQLDQGAIAAFERFNVLLQHAYTDAPVAEAAQA
ncbi:biliverdin-producing heme oxygenase [Pseudomonas syringae]|uniref:Biliverdin-producing heme oxygenase n=2 Tax=Pseudomonas syringae group TaxID=136849 RepID=A0A9Q4FI84_PSESX|nr:biliverdin-producing heme oxygenase [Pseudomonas syringae]KTB69813.1 heme oxygenase [Pseudomonas viridiflava ICMP 13104]KTB84901.1 heme oxygenase [Pseudomonas syringae pv. syringae PD2766]MCF5470841.1 biliverdin-producing heme oxygenase [Pseudomonas syringae]MCF5474510.1 biliverdin-producing heme oxygenase [Pseudomonas syringae]MCF5484028.1 biliverdin-producing heme oxygenase [Pseudomonas syringae]